MDSICSDSCYYFCILRKWFISLRATRSELDDRKYNITKIGQLIFLFDKKGFRNVWTLECIENMKPGTLDIDTK